MILLGGATDVYDESSTLTEVRIFDADDPTANGTALPPLSSGTASLYQPFEREESGNYIIHWVDFYDSTMKGYDMTNKHELSTPFPDDIFYYSCVAYNR